MLWWKNVFAIIAIFVTSSLAWTYHVMIGSRRDNNLANYRENHCQEEQGNGTVHLSMTIMSLKIFVIVFLVVTTIMIKMVSTTITMKNEMKYSWQYWRKNNNVAWYFTSRLTLILLMLCRTKKSPGTDRVTMIRPVIECWMLNVAMIKVSQMMIWEQFIINIPYIAVKPAIAW